MKELEFTRGISISEASCRFACGGDHGRPSFGYVELRARSTVATNGHWAIVVRRDPSGDSLPEGTSILVPDYVLKQAAAALRKAGHRGGIVGRTASDPDGTYEAKLMVPGLGADVSWTIPGSIQGLPSIGKILTPSTRIGMPCGLLRLNAGYLTEIYRAAKDADGGKVVAVSILPTGADPNDARRSQVILSGPRNWFAVLMPIVDSPKVSAESEIESTRLDYEEARASLLPLEDRGPSPVELAKALTVDPVDVPAAPETPAEAPAPVAPVRWSEEDAARASAEAGAKARKARKAAPPKAKPAPAPVPPPPPLPEADGVTVSRWAM